MDKYKTAIGAEKIVKYILSCLSNFLSVLRKYKLTVRARVAIATTPRYKPLVKRGSNFSRLREAR
jgi:hypothetical protein